MAIVTLLVGFIFGGIHCIACSFDFSSRIELFLWCISSAAIAGVHVIFSVCVGILGGLSLIQSDNSLADLVGDSVALWFCLASLLYIFARGASPVVAFATLRSLPPGAYQTVCWTTLVPHL